jgi:hypothetical protein
MIVTDQRLHDLAYADWVCNISPEVRECLGELYRLRQALKKVIEIETTAKAART